MLGLIHRVALLFSLPPQGLVVPVIRGVEGMNFADIEKTINMLGEKVIFIILFPLPVFRIVFRIVIFTFLLFCQTFVCKATCSHFRCVYH